MKKTTRIVLLSMLLSVGAAGVAQAAIYNEKRHAMCYDANGKFNPQSKDCDENSCGCFFHWVEETFKDLFK